MSRKNHFEWIYISVTFHTFGLGYEEIVKDLIDHNADVNVATDDNWKPIHWAAQIGD